MSIRLNKLLAQRGIGARRKCDTLIQEGAVRVNGRVVTEPGTQVEPERDRVSVRGRPLPPRAALRYFVLHKPVGVISTLSDPEQRRTVADFLPPGARVFPVGRLDADTSGLLILTNDGELAHHLMHPRYGVEKVYRVRLARRPDEHALERLRRGVEFEPGVVSAPCRVRVLSSRGEHAIIEIAIHEGRYRQVRRMCDALGLTVQALHRSAYGPLRLGPIERGMWRELSVDEVRRLRESAARPRARDRGSRPQWRGGRPRRDRVERGAPIRPERAERGAGERRRESSRPGPHFAPARSAHREPWTPPRGAEEPSGRRPARETRDRPPVGNRGARPRGGDAPSDRRPARDARDRPPVGKRGTRPARVNAPPDRRPARDTRDRASSGMGWSRSRLGGQPASDRDPRKVRDHASIRGRRSREESARGRGPRRGPWKPERDPRRAGSGPMRRDDRPSGRGVQRSDKRSRGPGAAARGGAASGEKTRRPAGPRSRGPLPNPGKRRRAF